MIKEEWVRFVEKGKWEDYQVIAICSTKEKAEKIEKEYNQEGTYDLATIREVPLDIKL